MRIVLATVVAVATALLGATGCSGEDGGEQQTPAERVAQARQRIDRAASVEVDLSTDRLPDGVDGVTRAHGVGNHDPAFRGTIDIVAAGFAGEAPVVAVDEKVFVELPFTSRYVPVEPTAYGAPDPAVLMSTENGLSALLTRTRDLTGQGERRRGEAVLTELTGTLPGGPVARLFPSADASGSFDVTLMLTEDNALDTATITGPFYRGSPDVRYDIAIRTRDRPVTITRP